MGMLRVTLTDAHSSAVKASVAKRVNFLWEISNDVPAYCRGLDLPASSAGLQTFFMAAVIEDMEFALLQINQKSVIAQPVAPMPALAAACHKLWSVLAPTSSGERVHAQRMQAK
jgi:hypothetical protein